jgi:DNA (cytosine-5)-methyltransferase 1
LRHYPISQLYGKSIKDKRGGDNNIHSWDIEYKGTVSADEKELLNTILKERRKKKWAEIYGIDWMDGMPLTIEHIRTFYNHKQLDIMLADLVQKGYIKQEYPKKKIGNARVQDPSLPLGYNIVTGKMSFEINKILDPQGITPTLVAMDMQHLFVVDGEGLRTLSLREGLRLFGYPDNFKFATSRENGYDLLGNTVVVPVIKAVAERALNIYCEVE